jgi:ribose transport system substrate-binding protein
MKNLRKAFVLVISLALLVSTAACAATPTPAASQAPVATQAPADTQAATQAPAADGTKPYIAIISKGFQHQFWQTVFAGAKDAAAKYNVDITFDGPPSESDISVQLDMLNAAIAKKPVALALAALDTKSVTSQLSDCQAKGIPVIGFDSGVPGAPAGQIAATAATNNESAGAVAADNMFKEANFQAAIKAATTDKPVVIGLESQDATSASIVGRTVGFINEMVKNCETLQAGKVEVKGHDKYVKAATSGSAAVIIQVVVPPSTSVTDCTAGAQSLLAMDNLLGIFASNSGSVDGIMAATTDGKDLDRATGKYKNLLVVGFDAGKTLKAAVRNKWFFGAITQDPYMIGYLSVELAYKAYKGETVADVDTGCHFYDSTNMDQPDIAKLLYD